MTTNRFDILSSSESGLTYVRERRNGIMRVLTASELQDFADPPPCPECAEQFGCEHMNCAGEPLLTDAEIDTTVPEPWRAFAKTYGVSANDMPRLAALELRDGQYHAPKGADMRTVELALLMNEE